PTRDPRQLGREAGPLAGALRQAAPKRSARSRHHVDTGPGACLGGPDGGVRGVVDSVLERFPDRADALAGRARTIAWGGDLDRAEGLWRTALERHPDDPELLVGLAQTLYWKGQPDLAAVYATRARAVAPEDRTARDLARAVRAALRPEIATNVDGA